MTDSFLQQMGKSREKPGNHPLKIISVKGAKEILRGCRVLQLYQMLLTSDLKSGFPSI